VTRTSRAVVASAVLAAMYGVGVHSASAAPTACASSPTYGVGVAIIPEFVGTEETAVTAYPGEVLDYDVTVFLKQDPPGTPGGVTVCPIENGTLTLRLPDGSGPFTIGTGINLPVGGSVVFENVPVQKYTLNPADMVTVPGCAPSAACPDRVEATAQVNATSEGPDDGPEDDAPVTATATAPTFLLAPSTQATVASSASSVTPGQAVQWTVTETNDTPPRFAPAALSAVRVELSTDGGATPFTILDQTSPNFSGDTNNDQRLDVGETWTWTVTTTPQTDTTVTATGFGTGPRAHVLTFPADPEERNAASVVVAATPAAPTPPIGTLPVTGSSASLYATVIAGFVIAAGATLVTVARRRASGNHSGTGTR
jgi:LPXTG-motif cell wall-anchored protein